ncbi:MAG TPA: hypothetical protein VFK02_24600 [Kofleriaceae bacterium]|nr:hypothetical protein [Kofleriaceae bacterium]
MRADFLDRLGFHKPFFTELTRGLAQVIGSVSRRPSAGRGHMTSLVIIIIIIIGRSSRRERVIAHCMSEPRPFWSGMSLFASVGWQL